MSLGTPWMLLLLPLVALAGWLMARCAPLAARGGMPAERGVAAESERAVVLTRGTG